MDHTHAASSERLLGADAAQAIARPSGRAPGRPSGRASGTEILHVYMPSELKERFRRLQAQLQLDRGQTWKLSEIARAVLTLGLEAGEDEILQSLDEARV
jgi:hypothetical protein